MNYCYLRIFAVLLIAASLLITFDTQPLAGAFYVQHYFLYITPPKGHITQNLS